MSEESSPSDLEFIIHSSPPFLLEIIIVVLQILFLAFPTHTMMFYPHMTQADLAAESAILAEAIHRSITDLTEATDDSQDSSTSRQRVSVSKRSKAAQGPESDFKIGGGRPSRRRRRRQDLFNEDDSMYKCKILSRRRTYEDSSYLSCTPYEHRNSAWFGQDTSDRELIDDNNLDQAIQNEYMLQNTEPDDEEVGTGRELFPANYSGVKISSQLQGTLLIPKALSDGSLGFICPEEECSNDKLRKSASLWDPFADDNTSQQLDMTADDEREIYMNENRHVVLELTEKSRLNRQSFQSKYDFLRPKSNEDISTPGYGQKKTLTSIHEEDDAEQLRQKNADRPPVPKRKKLNRKVSTCKTKTGTSKHAPKGSKSKENQQTATVAELTDDETVPGLIEDTQKAEL